MTMTYDEARAALDAKTLAERDLARIATCPPWRHAAFAAIETALVASPLTEGTGQLLVFVAIIVGVLLIVRSDRRRLGVFVNGYRRGRTRRVVVPLMLVMLGLFMLSSVAAQLWHRPLVSIVCAAITFPACYYGSVVWQRVFRRELGL